MKVALLKQLFSTAYIQIHFSERTREGIWWCDVNGHDFWSGEHTFDCDALYYVTEGEFELTVGEKHYRVRPGQMSYVPAGVPHTRRIRNQKTVRKYYTHFDLLFGTEPLSTFFELPTVMDIKDAEQTVALYKILRDCYKNGNSPLSVIRGNGALLQLLALVIEENGGILNPAKKESDHSMQAVLHFIQANLHRNITVAELAAITGYSTDHFSRTFRKCFGISPLGYVTKLKINKAKRQLQETRLSVAVIAEGLGYCDANYFAKIFKSRVGVSPLQYRKTARHRV
ncbi:MAG: helix-turn-helix domain-containing protein [Clostridia bacterium]|nr:helix-turn-helix domain-containing protein [Clostridia bacterium]